MVETTEKLTKKQRKALEFRTNTKKTKKDDGDDTVDKTDKKRKRDDADEVNKEESSTTDLVEGADGTEVKKKRKTRRGKKGKGSSSGPRFLLFVGNLPYDITESELIAHFAACGPDRIRIRSEKGIAFLEFDGQNKDIQHKMEVALRLHHSSLRQRKINVELTVGGGGNSTNRLEKIKTKNSKLDDERKDKIDKKKKEINDKKNVKNKPVDQESLKNVHPSRQHLIR